MFFLSTGCRWGLALLLAVSLGGCQRAAYQFQPLAATPYQAPTPAPLADSLQATSKAQEPAARPEAARPRRAHQPARVALAARRSPMARLVKLPHLGAVASVSPTIVKVRPLPGPPDEPLHHRTKGIAFLLAFFLGGLGGHLFYLGYHKRAVAYLLLTLAGGLLLFVGAVGLLLALFSSGGGAYLVALLIGSILLSVVSALALIDAVRILTNDLKPREGEYYPRFFQTR
ncbi:NINE protein [Hymenobacter bucti]|uniref:NINE protein n=1 Tax=Hymenobacter bucti TaxID=1844114 RepID=A0ABW4QQC6_9BACT